MSTEDKLKENIKSPYPHDKGTFWDSFMSTIGGELDNLIETEQNVLLTKTIDSASGKQLERIAKLTGIVRKTNESDTSLRYRAKLEMKKHLTSPTVGEIQEVCGILLDIPPSKIIITESFNIEYARFSILIRKKYLKERDITKEELRGLVNKVKPAGVRVVIEVKGSYSYRSENDYLNNINNTNKGYNESEYAALLRGIN